MLFSEKMTRIPQPRRQDLWNEYRALCGALALNVRLRKESRAVTEEELIPLKQAARNANGILAEYGFTPSFFPEEADFFEKLTDELTAVASNPSNKD